MIDTNSVRRDSAPAHTALRAQQPVTSHHGFPVLLTSLPKTRTTEDRKCHQRGLTDEWHLHRRTRRERRLPSVCSRLSWVRGAAVLVSRSQTMDGATFPSRWSPGLLHGPPTRTSKPGAFAPCSAPPGPPSFPSVTRALSYPPPQARALRDATPLGFMRR